MPPFNVAVGTFTPATAPSLPQGRPGLERKDRLLPARTTVAGRDAQVQNLAVNIGAERARYESQTRIEGPAADVKMYSLTVAEESQEFDQRT